MPYSGCKAQCLPGGTQKDTSSSKVEAIRAEGQQDQEADLQPVGLLLALLLVVVGSPVEVGVASASQDGEVDDEANDAAKEHQVANSREHNEHQGRPAASARPAQANDEESRSDRQQQGTSENERKADWPCQLRNATFNAQHVNRRPIRHTKARRLSVFIQREHLKLQETRKGSN